jgi:hypothetical protein
MDREEVAMETEATETPAYLPATSPDWAQYYKRAKQTRRLGKGQHSRIQTETKRRRRKENLMVLGSIAFLIALVAVFYSVLGPSAADSNAAPLRPAHARRG